jgi:hypothetical protein
MFYADRPVFFVIYQFSNFFRRGEEADLMRLFFGLSETRVRDSSVMKTDVDNTSCLSSCHIGRAG